MLSPEWVSVVINGAVVGGGLIITYGKIASGQAVAKERETRHSADIVIINNKLDSIMNGESKCKLAFTDRISKIEQKTEGLQNELTDAKHSERIK